MSWKIVYIYRKYKKLNCWVRFVYFKVLLWFPSLKLIVIIFYKFTDDFIWSFDTTLIIIHIRLTMFSTLIMQMSQNQNIVLITLRNDEFKFYFSCLNWTLCDVLFLLCALTYIEWTRSQTQPFLSHFKDILVCMYIKEVVVWMKNNKQIENIIHLMYIRLFCLQICAYSLLLLCNSHLLCYL